MIFKVYMSSFAFECFYLQLHSQESLHFRDSLRYVLDWFTDSALCWLTLSDMNTEAKLKFSFKPSIFATFCERKLKSIFQKSNGMSEEAPSVNFPVYLIFFCPFLLQV